MAAAADESRRLRHKTINIQHVRAALVDAGWARALGEVLGRRLSAYQEVMRVKRAEGRRRVGTGGARASSLSDPVMGGEAAAEGQVEGGEEDGVDGATPPPGAGRRRSAHTSPGRARASPRKAPNMVDEAAEQLMAAAAGAPVGGSGGGGRKRKSGALPGSALTSGRTSPM